MQQTSETMNGEDQRRGPNRMSSARHQAGTSRNGAIRKDETDEESPKFVFVDVSGPNGVKVAANKRLIRQHAMKDIGRSRRRPKKNVTIELDFAPLETSERTTTTPSWPGYMWFGAGRLDPFLRFPMTLDATARGLVAHSEWLQ
jgi:hypothetical protein